MLWEQDVNVLLLFSVAVLVEDTPPEESAGEFCHMTVSHLTSLLLKLTGPYGGRTCDLGVINTTL